MFDNSPITTFLMVALPGRLMGKQLLFILSEKTQAEYTQ